MPAPNYQANRQWCLDRAESHFGKVVEFFKENVSTTTQVRFQCEYGHEPWNTTINNMQRKNTWCPDCTLHITEKFIGWALNRIFGEEYLFTSIQPKWLSEKRNANCDFINEELGLYLEVDGWATHGDKKDNALMNLMGQAYENPVDVCEEHENFKTKKAKENNIDLIRIPHEKYEQFPVIMERLYDILITKFKDKIIVKKEDILTDLPNKAEVARHYINRRRREVELALQAKNVVLDKCVFTSRKDRNISVFCSKCKTATKLWTFDDIVRTDKSARKLMCDVCCSSTPVGDDKLAELCQGYGFTYISRGKIGHDIAITMSCPNDHIFTKNKAAIKKKGGIKCPKC